eukprot:NODE_481_length_1435_cov_337.554113_g361_i0.p2 GENE.NODE_481_length_1435_cov_337.554113_g361_i0~~NODE_481_length_1435_cov_337.554113_g361_i0.p2  ORF type:complete len:359 (+),score=152.49 NODE_481_length_1435_cov_337.554113_g361_i0:29-1105(+)
MGAFINIIATITELRAFLPQSLLTQKDDAPVEEAPQVEGKHHRHQSVDRRSNAHSSRSGGSHSSLSSRHKKKDRNAAGLDTSLSLSSRSVSVLVLNVRNWGKFVTEYSNRADMIITVIGEITNAAQDAAQATRGVVQTMSGGSIAIVWNAVVNTAQHRSNACKASQLLLAQLRKSLEPWRLSVSVGLGSSKVMCGMVGSARMRHFDMLGAAFANATALANLGVIWDTDILCDPYVAEESRLVIFRIIGRVTLTNPDQTPATKVMLAEITGTQTISEDEWMYQLDAAEKTDPHALCNKAWSAFLAGNSAMAKTHLGKMGDADIPGDLQEMVNNGTDGQAWAIEYPLPFTAKKPGCLKGK